MRETARVRLGLPFARILGTIERHNAFPDDPIQMRGGWAIDRDDLLAQAGAGRTTWTSPKPMTTTRSSTCCSSRISASATKGEGADFVRRNTFTVAARCRSTPRAGNCRSGRPARPAATSGMVEAIRQFTGRSLGAQVENARLGLVSGFGMINYDRGLCSGAAVLAAA